jgi:cytochrome c oxidase cbb3-type subunit III
MRIKTLSLAAAGACVCVMAALWLQRYRLEAQLLRADPAGLPTNSGLMSYARRRGESVYDRHCSQCHGLAGQGDSTRGIPDLRDRDWLYGMGTISDIEQVVNYGIRSYHPKARNLAIMPAYGTPHPSARDSKIPPLSPGNIRDLVVFLLYQQGRGRTHGGGVADAAVVARGAALFAGVGGCYDCHGPDGKGDPAIGAPNLTDQITLYGDDSPEALTQSISYGRAGVCPAWLTRLGPAGVREVSVYVFSLPGTAPR